MAIGASTADLAIILMDARKGVLPQSRRHAFIASLPGISRFVVAINKVDIIQYEAVFRSIEDEFRRLLDKLQVPSAYFLAARDGPLPRGRKPRLSYPRWLAREPTIDIVDVKTAGQRGTKDPDLLELAVEQDRIVTYD